MSQKSTTPTVDDLASVLRVPNLARRAAKKALVALIIERECAIRARLLLSLSLAKQSGNTDRVNELEGRVTRAGERVSRAMSADLDILDELERHELETDVG